MILPNVVWGRLLRKILSLLTVTFLVCMPAYGAQKNQNEDYNLPRIGEAGAGTISPQEEYAIGNHVVAGMRQAGVILQDPLTTQYLQNIGHELSSHSDRPDLTFSFFAVNDASVNAFALPGGFIGVNTGLVLDTDNENELAAVMAHEISHVTQRHIARQLENQSEHSLGTLAAVLGSILVAAASGDPDVAQAAIFGTQAALMQHQINYTRSQEYEADRVGIGVLARSGFSPSGMADFFEKLQQQARIAGDNFPAFLSNHPTNTQRITEARERAREMHVKPHQDTRMYGIIKTRLRVLMSDNLNKLLAQLQETVRTSTGTERQNARYGVALALVRLGRPTEAVPVFESLYQSDNGLIPFTLGLADAQFSAGKISQADSTYEHAITLFPGNRAVVLAYARALLSMNKPAKARDMLVEFTALDHHDPEATHLLARASANAGSPSEGHYYLSDYYLMNDNIYAAIDQVSLALRTPGISPIERSRYQTRLDDLKEIWRSLPSKVRREQSHPDDGGHQ